MNKKANEAIKYRDTALALTFLCLLIWLFSGSVCFVYLAMLLLFVAMIVPRGMKYPSKAWFGLAQVLNLVMSKVILGLAFFVLVVPVGAIRKLLGRDPMRFKAWRDGQPSAFVIRDKRMGKEDLSRQF